MAMPPLIYDDPYICSRRCHQYRQPNHDFAFGLNPHDLTAIIALPSGLRSLDNRSRSDMKKKDGGPLDMLPTTGKDGFQVCVDVQQFNPNEISIKTVDNHVIIRGKHEEREDEHGFISRRFTRRYTIPKGYDPNSVTSSLSSDGILTIKAPPPNALESSERIISITHTGPAHLNVKENKTDKEIVEDKKEEAA